MRILKTLAIAAALAATVIPAKADPNTLPAFRAITAFSLYQMTLPKCDSTYVNRARMLAQEIAEKAKQDQPSLDLERAARSVWEDPSPYAHEYVIAGGCVNVVARLERILEAGKVVP
jgi:hypothetical protein